MKKTNYSYKIISIDTATSIVTVLFTSTNTFYIDVTVPIPISDPENLDLVEKEIKCRNPVAFWKSQEWLPFPVKSSEPVATEKVNAFDQLLGLTKNLDHEEDLKNVSIGAYERAKLHAKSLGNNISSEEI